MEDRKRTILAVIIACVVLAAVLYSFSLTLFIQTPALELPDPDASASQSQASADPEAGGIPVEVTPQTVQLAVASLSRYDSYTRTLTVRYYQQGEETGSITAQVWVDGGWTRTDTTLPSGVVESTLVGNGELWLWYGGSREVYHAAAGDNSADLTQRIPTYEDVLELDVSGITAAGYEQRDGQPCIYVEFSQPELGYLYRYWIAVGSGLLHAAQLESEGEVVYAMSSHEVTSPLSDGQEHFLLPDGTDPQS